MQSIKQNLFRYITFVAFCVLASMYASAAVPSHGAWDKILRKYVNNAGWVDYKGIIKDKAEFETYLALLSSNPPEKSWSSADREAYWINAYNAFTVKLIIDHYPVKSIKDIGPKHQIVRINTPWQKKFFRIGGKRFKLDKIENQILRKDFNDPRIHFAIVCASRSCARLRNEAYTGAKLEEQLNDQARDFLRTKAKNEFESSSKAELSPYFDWFGKDFKKKSGTVVAFINLYAPVKLKEDADIEYKDYDWSLNEQR